MSISVQPSPERRQLHQLREVFVSCCELIAPVVAANEKVKTISNFAMARMLSDYFPLLSATEIHIVIMTTEKMNHQTRMRLMHGADN